MKAFIITAMCAVTLLSARARCYAGLATASAGGAFIETTDMYVFNSAAVTTPPTDAENTFSDGSHYHAYATVNGPNLAAFASAERPNTVESQYPRAGAEAAWEDLLTLENPNLITSEIALLHPIVHFEPYAAGRGINGSGSFSASLTDVNDQSVTDNSSASLPTDIPQLRMHFLHLETNINAVITDSIIFRMSLEAGTKSTLAPGQSAFADYGHSAHLPPIYITDAAGNPIPELAGLQIVGSSGLQYPVTVIPKIPGDYNRDGIVDAADYVVWRKNIGAEFLMNRDPNATDLVDQDDYTFWRSHFGNTAGTGSGANANATVPEPTSALLVLVGMLVLTSRRREAV